MKIFVINLNRRPDRLKEITTGLNDLNLTFERIIAIDADQTNIWPHVSTIKAHLFKFGALLPGSVACFLSHQVFWRIMVERNIAQAMVLEDDAVAQNFDPEILSINLRDYGLDQLRLEEVRNKPKLYLPIKGVPKLILGRQAMPKPSFGTACYILTLEGAKKMLRAEKYWFNVDYFDMWSALFDLRTAILRPNMFKQSDSYSDIAKDAFFYGRN